MSFSKREIKTALKSSGTSFRQRGGQTAKKLGMKAPTYKMSAYETKKFLKESGMSKSGVKEVMTELKQQGQPQQKDQFQSGQQAQKFEKLGQEQQPQKGGMKTPEWMEKVEKQGEISQTSAFGRRVEEDVRLQKAGQQQQGVQRQPSSDVDRSQYSQEKINQLEQKGQNDYYDKASQTNKYNKLDEAEDNEADKIDNLLSGGQGGGGGEAGGGGAGGEE